MKWSADQNWKTLSGWGPSHGIPKIHPISNVELHLSQGVPRCPKVSQGAQRARCAFRATLVRKLTEWLAVFAPGAWRKMIKRSESSDGTRDALLRKSWSWNGWIVRTCLHHKQWHTSWAERVRVYCRVYRGIGCVEMYRVWCSPDTSVTATAARNAPALAMNLCDCFRDDFSKQPAISPVKAIWMCGVRKLLYRKSIGPVSVHISTK